MRVVMFNHSLVSDWNHGNAHFLRGIVSELQGRGHEVHVLEPRGGWSREHLIEDHGAEVIGRFHRAYPGLRSHLYDLETLDLDRELQGADLVLVHEWNDHSLVARIGQHRQLTGGYHLLFHDTHHRSVTEPESMGAYDLGSYDGVLAFGEVIRRRYLEEGWAERAWTWHEAADIRLFRPLPGAAQGDVVWIGNWGDEERTAELQEFLIAPVEALHLRARVHGVRYPAEALQRLERAGIEYAGWLPNFKVPRVFASHRVTLHIPRRPYVEALPGIPTIRVFEALACGIPLVSAPWDDAEGLFSPGDDFMIARNGAEMRDHLRMLLSDPERARCMAERGRATILARHTCAHRADQLLDVVRELDGERSEEASVQKQDAVEAG
jgi:spore maturation protein CgeB